MQNINPTGHLLDLPDFVFGNDPGRQLSTEAKEVDISETGGIPGHQSSANESPECPLIERETVSDNYLPRFDVVILIDDVAIDKLRKRSLAENS